MVDGYGSQDENADGMEIYGGSSYSVTQGDTLSVDPFGIHVEWNGYEGLMLQRTVFSKVNLKMFLSGKLGILGFLDLDENPHVSFWLTRKLPKIVMRSVLMNDVTGRKLNVILSMLLLKCNMIWCF